MTKSPGVILDGGKARFEAPRSRCAALRRMLLSDRLEFLMEAHNGLSARIVREAGFQGIWASGLSISAQFGVRDNNEASWTQVVDMLEFMADASNLPILLDGDTGYGNFNNVRRLVRKLEQRGIAGVCIEDKQFPKTNSFLNGDRQPLADIGEFCGKITAGKSAQLDPDFSIVARVEALIAGWGMEEALRRAEAYRRAGADAILIHSKLSKPDEILTFAREWGGRAPLVIVPTRYYSTPTDVFRKAGISVVIWANHVLRSAAAAMQSTAREIFESETLVNVEDRIASVEEIFRLQDADEYSAAERLYLSAASSARGAVVLAASRGNGLEAVTADRPKVMLPIAGKPLLRWLVDAFKKESVNDITVVGGYRADAIDVAGIRLVVNERYEQTGELASLACAIEDLQSDTVISYGDLLFRSYVLRDLVESEAEFAVVVDSSPTGESNRTVRDFAYCSRRDDRGLFGTPVLLRRVLSAADAPNGAAGGHEGQSGVSVGAAHGRWIGLLKVSRAGLARLKKVVCQLRERADFEVLDIPHLLNELVEQGATVEVQYVHGHWRGVNDLEDFRRATDFAHAQRRLGDSEDADAAGPPGP
jgi:phosphoenolpyruvate phosphomutase